MSLSCLWSRILIILCFLVCLFVSNKRQNRLPIRPMVFFCSDSHDIKEDIYMTAWLKLKVLSQFFFWFLQIKKMTTSSSYYFWKLPKDEQQQIMMSMYQYSSLCTHKTYLCIYLVSWFMYQWISVVLADDLFLKTISRTRFTGRV